MNFPQQLEVIMKEAEKLLIKSGYSAKYRTENREDYKRKNIKYELGLGTKLVEQIKKELPAKWLEWVYQTYDFIFNNRDDSKRPTIDRRDSNGNYCIDNIEFLPFEEHIMKDRAIGVTVYDLSSHSFSNYPTMTKAGEILGNKVDKISKYTDSGVVMDKRYIIQAEKDKKGGSNFKRKSSQKYIAVINVILDEYDDAGNIIRTFPAQIKKEIEFPEIKMIRN